MARWETKIKATREYSGVIEAPSADIAQAMALTQMGEHPEDADETSVQIEVTRGVS